MRKEVWFGLSIMAAVVIALFVMMPSPEQMTNGHLGLLMLALIVVAIMLGFPTAFTLMGLGTMFTWFAYYSVNPDTAVQQTLDLMVQRAYWVMNNDVLISVPLFVFMGYLVERANLIESLVQEPASCDHAHTRIACRSNDRDLCYFCNRLGHYRRRGDIDGPARLSGDAQGRIQHPTGGGSRNRGWHPRHTDPAVGASDPLWRHRGCIGDAAIRRRLLSRNHAGSALCRLRHRSMQNSNPALHRRSPRRISTCRFPNSRK